jgi:ketosteroid isomerase-like protein
MDRETFNNWLASYRSAWTSGDREAAASLYADDTTYQVTPFDEPLRGRAAI